MPIDGKGRPVGLLQVMSHADGEVAISLYVMPGGNNAPVIDAAYAVLDDMVGVFDRDDPDGGGDEPAQPFVVGAADDPDIDIVPLDEDTPTINKVPS